MKEEFDLSHYLNVGKEPKEQQTLSAIVEKVVANQQEKQTEPVGAIPTHRVRQALFDI